MITWILIKISSKFIKYQFSSVTQLCPTLWDPMNCSMPGLPVHHHLPEFTQTHIHRVGDAIHPSHPLSSPLSSMLLLSHFSRIRLCATPQTTAHQAPLSLGFSRQEHWSGLPFPSPMHESKKWKQSRLVVSNSSQPHGLQPTRLFCPWDFPGKSTGVGSHY